MEQVRLTLAIVIAVILQWTLRNVAEPFAFVDLPLIIIVYAALQRNSIRGILFGTFAGIAIDALSGGLLGSSAFSKTLVAYMVSELARRVYLDNLLLRIPVVAGACLLDDLIYLGLHQVFGRAPSADVVTTISYTLIGTTVGGTVIYLLFDKMFSERRAVRKQEMRQTRRRNPIRLGK
jgi:rod shape-determining protein MreD